MKGKRHGIRDARQYGSPGFETLLRNHDIQGVSAGPGVEMTLAAPAITPCQHSAAEGGTRGRLPPASDSRATSRCVGINFAFVISSQCCACRYSACACSLSQFFTEDDMAKKAKKAKKTAKAATKKVAKKTSKKKK